MGAIAGPSRRGPCRCRPCSTPMCRCRSWHEPRQRRLEDVSANTVGGRRQAMFVSGEAGAGKSRLVAEFARSVHDRGGLVLAGSCSPDLDLPYQPFVEALGSLLEPLPVERRRELAGAGAADLALLLPRLALTDAPAGSDAGRGSSAGRYWLFEAVVGLLARLTRTAPVLVVLEDLHWARSSTALLVDHLLCEQRLSQVCLLVTLRSSSQDLSDAVGGLLADLPRRSGVERLAIEGLGTEQVTELVGRLVGHRLDDPLAQLARHLSEVTAGNPFLIGEQWRQLVDDGRVRRTDRHWQVTGPPAEATSPATVQELISRTVGRIGPEAQRLLPVAAVAGVTFDATIVARAADLDVAQALAALEQAVGAELVVPAGTAGFRFRHELVCQALAEGLGPASRRQVHLRARPGDRGTRPGSPRRAGPSLHPGRAPRGARPSAPGGPGWQPAGRCRPGGTTRASAPCKRRSRPCGTALGGSICCWSSLRSPPGRVSWTSARRPRQKQPPSPGS